jgi:hypothetical protein
MHRVRSPVATGTLKRRWMWWPSGLTHTPDGPNPERPAEDKDLQSVAP